MYEFMTMFLLSRPTWAQVSGPSHHQHILVMRTLSRIEELPKVCNWRMSLFEPLFRRSTSMRSEQGVVSYRALQGVHSVSSGVYALSVGVLGARCLPAESNKLCFCTLAESQASAVTLVC